MKLLSKAARKGKKGEASMLKQTRLRKTGLVHFQGASNDNAVKPVGFSDPLLSILTLGKSQLISSWFAETS